MFINFPSAVFLKSVPKCALLPCDKTAEIAFAGRSNAGKSTLLNRLCQKSRLAKTSSTPGKTRDITLFSVESVFSDGLRLVDLPGYGYAKVNKTMKKLWQKELTLYLQTRVNLKVLVVIMDARHPFTELDRILIDLISKRALQQVIVFNKIDKLNQSEKHRVTLLAEEITYQLPNCRAVLHSSTRNIGTKELANILCQMGACALNYQTPES